MLEDLCKSIFMVIREEISSTKSLVYLPDCQVVQNTQSEIVIHNYFKKSKSRIVTSKFEDWNYEKISKSIQEENNQFIIDSQDYKLRSFVLINDPSSIFYNTTTKLGLEIDKQYVVSSSQDPPS